MPTQPDDELDATRWEQVLARDPGARGRFLYAVTSTGIYCQPDCPSRRPRLDRVRFFADAAAARAAGFRPCLRCRPDEDTATPAWLAPLLRRLEAEPPAPLAELATLAGLSPWHLQRRFRQWTGLTPRAYAAAARTGRLQQELRQQPSATDAIVAAGYGSPSRVYGAAAPVPGMTPGQLQRGGASAVVAYALLDSPLGLLLVAATARGVCAVEHGRDASALRATLAARLPHAQLREDAQVLAPHLEALRDYLARPASGLALPLDVSGTLFQRQVWALLAAIPPGQTRTYAQLAQALGRPGAARAVGSACAGNPVPLAVPCHRAVGSGGALTGFRWGLAVKRALLDAEAATDRDPVGNAAAGPLGLQ